MPVLDNQLKSPSPLLLPAQVCSPWLTLFLLSLVWGVTSFIWLSKKLVTFIGRCNSTFWGRSNWCDQRCFCICNWEGYIHCKFLFPLSICPLNQFFLSLFFFMSSLNYIQYLEEGLPLSELLLLHKEKIVQDVVRFTHTRYYAYVHALTSVHLSYSLIYLVCFAGRQAWNCHLKCWWYASWICRAQKRLIHRWSFCRT